MKKQLESELISVAHNILKLAGREDLGKMEAEISTLYKKITILKFLEDNQPGLITNTKDLTSSFFDSISPTQLGIKKTKAVNQKKSEPEKAPTVTTKQLQKAPVEKEIETKMQYNNSGEIESREAGFEKKSNLISEIKERDLSSLSPSYFQLPIFDAKYDIPEKQSLNDKLKVKGLQIGLNDRLAFVKGLFKNSNKDYERALSQISTLESYNDVINLLDTIIKPNYNNWKDQEELESRFLEIIEDNFN